MFFVIVKPNAWLPIYRCTQSEYCCAAIYPINCCFDGSRLFTLDNVAGNATTTTSTVVAVITTSTSSVAAMGSLTSSTAPSNAVSTVPRISIGATIGATLGGVAIFVLVAGGIALIYRLWMERKKDQLAGTAGPWQGQGQYSLSSISPIVVSEQQLPE